MTDAPIRMLAAGLLLGASLPAQVTVGQAVDQALKYYPSIRVTQEQINAAGAGIELARTAYLPRIEALAQANRATRNNVFGLLLPQSVIPSMSGPVLGTNNLGTAWGSAIGALVTWEPFDFGLRRAGVEAANAGRAHLQATLRRTEFEVMAAAADACLTLIATQETVRAAEAGVERARTVQRTIGALVDAELRPGADAAREQAELGGAQTQLAQAQQASEVARATVAQFTGIDPAQVSLTAPALAGLPAEREAAPLQIAANPIAAEQTAMVEQAQAQLRALERSYFPRFYLQGSAYARGTSAETNGSLLGGLNGLAPSFQNYALGFTVSFPVSDIAALRARESAQSAEIRAQNARAQQIAVELRAQWNRAAAGLEGARRIAANTPAQVSAAQAALQQATARYQAGLGNIDAVAEAQRLLSQAEIDSALARLGVWRGLLAIAAAAGDLRPFLAEVSR